MIAAPMPRQAEQRLPAASSQGHVRLGFWLVALVAVAIVAHGCHRGEHDDEPLFSPIEHRVSSLDPQS